jgi:hypothetical protein
VGHGCHGSYFVSDDLILQVESFDVLPLNDDQFYATEQVSVFRRIYCEARSFGGSVSDVELRKCRIVLPTIEV